MDDTVITREGLARLNGELERLQTEGRLAVAERLRRSTAEDANPFENGDYLAAREEQARLERRIALLEARLGAASPVDPMLGNGRVDVGERVRVRDLESGERLVLELVGPHEADVTASRISVASPLGRAVLGLRRGEVARVDAPRGRRHFKVLAVEA